MATMRILRSSAAALLVSLAVSAAHAEAPLINRGALVAHERAPKKRFYTWLVGGLAASLYEPRDLTMSGLVPDATKSHFVIATDVLWSLGAVAEGVATAMYFLEGRAKKPRAQADLVPIFLPSGAGFALSAKFH